MSAVAAFERVRRHSGRYRLLPNHEVETVDSLLEWAQEFETANRQIAFTKKFGGNVRISTVFLALDFGMSFLIGGPPLLFETLIFGGRSTRMRWRYSTWAEAVAGHKSVVRRARG